MSVEDWSKPIQTRCGVRVRLVGTVNYGGARETRVVVRVGKDGKDFGRLWECYEDGRQLGESDIINVPPRKETREVVAWAVTNKAGGVWSVLLTEAAARHSASHCCAPEESHVIRLTGTVEVEVAE